MQGAALPAPQTLLMLPLPPYLRVSRLSAACRPAEMPALSTRQSHETSLGALAGSQGGNRPLHSPQRVPVR